MIKFGRAVLGTSFNRSVAVQFRLTQQLRHVHALISKIDDPKRGACVALVNSQTEPGITYSYLAERSRCVAAAMSGNIDPSVHSIGKERYALSLLVVCRASHYSKRTLY